MQEWANSLATQELVQILKQAKQESMDKWSRQGYETELNNAFALGGIATINEVIDFIEESKNEGK